MTINSLFTAARIGWNKYGSGVLTGGAMVAVPLVGYTSFQAGKKVGENPGMTTKEKLLTSSKAIAIGIVAEAMIGGAHMKDMSTIGALAAANLMNEKKRRESIAKTKSLAKDVLGEEKYNELENAVKKKKIFNDDKSEADEKKISELFDAANKQEFLVIDDFLGYEVIMPLHDIYATIDNERYQYAENGYISLPDHCELWGFKDIEEEVNTGYGPNRGVHKMEILGWDHTKILTETGSIVEGSLPVLPIVLIEETGEINGKEFKYFKIDYTFDPTYIY